MLDRGGVPGTAALRRLATAGPPTGQGPPRNPAALPREGDGTCAPCLLSRIPWAAKPRPARSAWAPPARAQAPLRVTVARSSLACRGSRRATVTRSLSCPLVRPCGPADRAAALACVRPGHPAVQGGVHGSAGLFAGKGRNLSSGIISSYMVYNILHGHGRASQGIFPPEGIDIDRAQAAGAVGWTSGRPDHRGLPFPRL